MSCGLERIGPIPNSISEFSEFPILRFRVSGIPVTLIQF